MRHTLTALALTLAGCSQEPQRSDSIAIHYLPGLVAHEDETIQDASEYLGLEIEVRELAPISVVMIDRQQGRYLGATEWLEPPCFVILWSIDDGLVLAHEIGHALGLRDVDEPDNLMASEIDGSGDLTDEQRDTIRHFAWLQRHRC